MDEEVITHLQDAYKQEYQGRDFALAYILHVLRGKINVWLYEQQLDTNTYSLDQQTALAVKALCNIGARVH